MKEEGDELAVTLVNLLIYFSQTTQETEHNCDTRSFLFPFVHTPFAWLLFLMLYVISRDKNI